MLTRMREVRRAVAASCAALLLLSGTAAHAEYQPNGKDSTASATLDLLLLRPLGLLGFGLGALFFVFPVLPVMAITRPQDIGRPFELMVGRPAQYVFADPLGTH